MPTWTKYSTPSNTCRIKHAKDNKIACMSTKHQKAPSPSWQQSVSRSTCNQKVFTQIIFLLSTYRHVQCYCICIWYSEHPYMNVLHYFIIMCTHSHQYSCRRAWIPSSLYAHMHTILHQHMYALCSKSSPSITSIYIYIYTFNNSISHTHHTHVQLYIYIYMHIYIHIYVYL